MYLSGESLIVILLVGIVAGWLAGKIINQTGFRLAGDLLIGIIGAFVGGWLMGRLGLHVGTGVILNTAIGAIVLLFVIRLVRGGGRWNSGWNSDWGGGWRRLWR